MKKAEGFSDLIKTKVKGIPSDRLVTCYRLWLETGDVMSRHVVTISPDQTTVRAAQMMSDSNISCIVVVDKDSVAGILTETDFLMRLGGKDRTDLAKVKVAEIMSSPVETVSADMSVFDASLVMSDKHIKRLPILSEGRLAGIVTQTDLVRALTSYGMWREVAQIMTSDVAAVQKNITVAEAAKIMTERDISGIVAMEANKPVGILTERDLLRRVVALRKDPEKVKLQEVMSSPVITVPPSYSVFSVSKIMNKMHVRRLIIADDEYLCGIVTQTDIFRAVKKKLQEDEEENLKLLERSESSIYTTDLNGTITYVNPAFMKLLEVNDSRELVGQPFLPEKFWFDAQSCNRFLEGLKNRSLEIKDLTLKTSTDRRVDVTVFSTFTKNIHGQINGSHGILYDITAKTELVALKEAQDALRESRKKYKTLYESSQDAIMLLTEEETFINGNPATIKLFGCKNEKEFLSKKPMDLSAEYQPDGMPSSEKWRKMMETAVKKGSHSFEWKHRRIDDTEFFATVLLTIMELKGKKVLQATIHDITARKKADEKLLQSSERYQRITDAVTDYIYTVYFKGTKVVKTIHSDACVAVTGYTTREIDADPNLWMNMVYDDDQNAVRRQIQQCASRQDVVPLEHRIVRKDGAVRWVKSTLVRQLGPAGQLLSYDGLIQDITDRKLAEEDLKQAKNQAEESHARTEQVNRKLKATYKKLMETSHQAGMAEVATDVLHNVGNILNSVNVSTTLIIEKITKSEVSNLKKVADMLQNHSNDLGAFLTKDPQGQHIPVYLTEASRLLIDEQADIIEKLESLAKNITHIKEIVKMQQLYAKVCGVEVAITLDEVIEDAIQINLASLHRNEIKLIREYSDLGDVTIDRQKVLQILVNLIGNAKHALATSGREEKLLTIRFYKHNEDRIRIDVIDNGAGIPRKNLTKIFQHGFTTRKDGHGFGLHSGALAAQEMEGMLTAHSDGPNQGAIFTLELPLKSMETAQCPM